MLNESMLKDLRNMVGHDLEPSEWFTIDQSRIDQFAECTDDHQYIHVDPERMAGSPWGSTISHGFLSLSLMAGHPPPDAPILTDQAIMVNYGLDRVRFLTPVRVNSQVRFHTTIVSVREKSPGRVLVKMKKSMEVRGHTKPAMIADVLFMVLANDTDSVQGD